MKKAVGKPGKTCGNVSSKFKLSSLLCISNWYVDAFSTPYLSLLEKQDQEILEKFKHEDSRNYAFHLLVKRYEERLYYAVRRLVVPHDDANDVLQDVFVKVWKKLDTFREDSQLYTWLYRIAINEALQFLRKRNKQPAFVSTDHHPGHEPSTMDGDQIVKKLQKAILALPDKQRLVFNMRYYDEMPYEQMSEVLGTSVGALKASYHHAAKKVEKHLLQGD